VFRGAGRAEIIGRQHFDALVSRTPRPRANRPTAGAPVIASALRERSESLIVDAVDD
jgi:hypothetical protein